MFVGISKKYLKILSRDKNGKLMRHSDKLFSTRHLLLLRDNFIIVNLAPYFSSHLVTITRWYAVWRA